MGDFYLPQIDDGIPAALCFDNQPGEGETGARRVDAPPFCPGSTALATPSTLLDLSLARTSTRGSTVRTVIAVSKASRGTDPMGRSRRLFRMRLVPKGVAPL